MMLKDQIRKLFNNNKQKTSETNKRSSYERLKTSFIAMGLLKEEKCLTTTKVSPCTSIATKEFTEGVRDVASCNSYKSEKSSCNDLDCTDPFEKLR